MKAIWLMALLIAAPASAQYTLRLPALQESALRQDPRAAAAASGFQFRWQPWNWGTTSRERDVLRIQQEIVRTEEAAFTEQLRRDVQDEVQTIARLQDAVALDQRIIALREQVERQARAQSTERAITPAESIEVRTDFQEPRLALHRHHVELAHARAQYLTTLGVALR